MKSLRKKVSVVLFSNHSREWIEYIEKKHTLSKYFDKVYYSYEMKKIKPSPTGFKFILKELKTKSENTLFIDDSMPNIYTANKLGINTHLFVDSINLKKEIEKYEYTR